MFVAAVTPDGRIVRFDPATVGAYIEGATTDGRASVAFALAGGDTFFELDVVASLALGDVPISTGDDVFELFATALGRLRNEAVVQREANVQLGRIRGAEFFRERAQPSGIVGASGLNLDALKRGQR